jgi:hypothetical protein
MTQKQNRKINSIPATLIAPCGMNCHLCRAYVRNKNACLGCRGGDSNKSKSCITCQIKNCEKKVSGSFKYCFECGSFPCARLDRLDNRYRTKYGMSMIENLTVVRSLGIRRFIENEKKRWACPECGRLLCVHKSECIYCQHVWR